LCRDRIFRRERTSRARRHRSAYKTVAAASHAAKAAIEETTKDRESIIITEIPYQVNKARLMSGIAELVQTKKLEGISDVRDEILARGMRIVIELKRGEESQLILNNLSNTRRCRNRSA